MQQQVYNTAREQQENSKRYSKRYSKFIRLFINNSLLIIENRRVYTGINSVVIFLFFLFKNSIKKLFSVTVAGTGTVKASGAGSVIASPAAFSQKLLRASRLLSLAPTKGGTIAVVVIAVPSLGLLSNHQKTTKEMLDKRLTIQEGFFKGARITITEAIAAELMEDYAKQSLFAKQPNTKP